MNHEPKYILSQEEYNELKFKQNEPNIFLQQRIEYLETKLAETEAELSKLTKEYKCHTDTN